MKACSTLFLLLFVANACKAQIVTLEPFIEGRDPYKLFMAVDNKVYIKGLPKNYSLKMKKGLVFKAQDGSWTIKQAACTQLYTDTLYVYKNGQFHSQLAVTVHLPPRKIIATTIGSSYSYTMTKQEVLDDPNIAIWPDSLNLKIDSMRMVILPKRGEMIGPFTIKGGNFLNDKTHLALSALRYGDRVDFSHITTTDRTGNSMAIPAETGILIK